MLLNLPPKNKLYFYTDVLQNDMRTHCVGECETPADAAHLVGDGPVRLAIGSCSAYLGIMRSLTNCGVLKLHNRKSHNI